MEESNVPSLKEFVDKYIPSKLPMNWHHEMFYDILTNKVIQKEDGKLYLNDSDRVNQNIMMLAPRFHAKSQAFTINYPLWEIYRNPNVRIMIVSANEEIAVSFNRAIMNQLENNHKLIDEHGYLVPEFQDKKKWGEKAILVKRDSMEKDPTVVAVGVGGKIISRRADIIIIDDLIDMDTARTKNSRRKTKDWFENVLYPVLESDGRLIIVGTAWYKGDFYDDMWTESEFDIRLKLKALMYSKAYERTDGKEVEFIPYKLHEWPMALAAQDVFSDEIIKHYRLWSKLKGGVLWEEKWSYQKLMEKKRKSNMSMGAFMRQYLNEPTTEEEKLFKDKMLKRALERGTAKALMPQWSNARSAHTGYGHLITAIGVDLAISKKTGADKSAIAVWGMNERRDRVLLYLDYGQWSPDEIKQKVIDAYYNYNPVKIRVENVAFQELLRQQLAEDVPVEGFRTTAQSKFSEETGISHIAMLLEQERVIIPSSRSNNDYYDRVRQLLYEMSVYSYDQHAGDVLMASWFAIDILRDFDKKMASNRGYFSTTALVEQLKRVRAAHKIVLLGNNPPVYKFAVQSLVYIFRSIKQDEVFFKEDESFLIFATKAERGVAYIYNKVTNELVGKIDGDTSALMFATLLEKAGRFFNNAQVVIDKNGEGEAVLLELQQRFYPKLLCLQPDANGLPVPMEGFKITSGNLPLAIEHFKQQVDRLSFFVPDDSLVKELGETIGVENGTMKMSFGTGQRIKTCAVGLWILDTYERREKKLYNQPRKKKRKQLKLPYRVFNQN